MIRRNSKIQFSLFASLLALVGLLVYLFLPALKIDGNDPLLINGLGAILGYTHKFNSSLFPDVKFLLLSPVLLIGLVLVLLAIVFLVTKFRHQNKLLLGIASIALIGAAVLFFLSPNLVVYADNIQSFDHLLSLIGGSVENVFTLGIGGLIGSIVLIVAAFLSITDLF